jgi:Fe-S-cluster-containing dehydrogenase component/anaerobic selenocysteine-containing dehydrogenase
MPLLIYDIGKMLYMKKNGKDPMEIRGIATGENDKTDEESNDPILDLFEGDFIKQGTSRRDFLKVLGFSFGSAAIMAGCKRPVQKALPYVIQPPEVTPGKSLYYATGYYDGHEYSGVLVKTRDGRPIKIEGNGLSLFNREGTTARVQASVLSLYDDARLKFPSINNKKDTWETTDEQIISELGKINSEAGEVVLLTSSIISPSTIKLINEFGSGFKNFRWVQYDAVSYSAILEANTICFGKTVIPDYRFENASIVVSVNADFLGTWLAPVHFIPGYVSRRKPDSREKGMVRHVQFESGMTLTGANADVRKKIKPSEEKILLTDLYNKIAEKTGGTKINGAAFREDITELSENLIDSKGKAIVISGTNNVDIQILVNAINSLLGNYAECIDLDHNIRIASGVESKMEELVNDLSSGKVRALLMYNVNPVYDYPDSKKFSEGIKNTALTLNMAGALNETVGKARYECPVNHYLESWDDAEIIPGQLSLSQPCINPIFDTRSFQDSLLKWSGSKISYHDYIKSHWEKEYFPLSDKKNFRLFWNDSLGNGVFRYSVLSGKPVSFNKAALSKVIDSSEDSPKGEFEILISESISLGTGMHANNPWLMELPDPVSKQCWENVAAISASDAEKLVIKSGDLIRISEGLVLPAFIQPGQAEGTVSIALGYGHTNSGPVCTNVGVNLYPFIQMRKGNHIYGFDTGKPENTHKQRKLALTQEHYTMEGRAIVRETVLSEYIKDPSSGNEFHKEFESTHKTLYPDIKYDGFHWGLSIDLNACVGCSSCVIACQAENNIPVVGKDEVTRRRIMHWIKIDRYYSENTDDPKVYFQPLACQHCDNAPCENVCPVSATTHSSEGLNQMTYNRCLGTKYCINNCPYKVRRFNWYRYTNNKAFDFNTASDLGKMVLNPDVTVRERGVVEKCSFCVQRIQEKKLQAKLENRMLEDNEIKTACMQACPAGAIVFGNLNDKDSKVSGLFRDPRCYHLLEELHTLPNTGYLTKVRNDGKLDS